MHAGLNQHKLLSTAASARSPPHLMHDSFIKSEHRKGPAPPTGVNLRNMLPRVARKSRRSKAASFSTGMVPATKPSCTALGSNACAASSSGAPMSGVRVPVGQATRRRGCGRERRAGAAQRTPHAVRRRCCRAGAHAAGGKSAGQWFCRRAGAGTTPHTHCRHRRQWRSRAGHGLPRSGHPRRRRRHAPAPAAAVPM